MKNIGYLKSAWDIALLKSKTIISISKDHQATSWSIMIVLLTNLFLVIVPLLFPQLSVFPMVIPDIIPLYIFIPLVVILVPLFTLLFFLLGILILYGLAKLFGGKGDYKNLLRPMGLASIVNVLGILPYLNILASIWSLVISVVILKETQKLALWKAIAVVLIPLVIWVVFGLVTQGMAFFKTWAEYFV